MDILFGKSDIEQNPVLNDCYMITNKSNSELFSFLIGNLNDAAFLL